MFNFRFERQVED